MRSALILSLLFLMACASNNNKYTTDNFGIEIPPNVYVVQSGDTLFAIAWRYGLDQQSIMNKNNIRNPNKIFVGQKLYLSTLSSDTEAELNSAIIASKTNNTSVVSSTNWVWPMRGRLLKRFHAGQVGANGIRIAGKPKQTVNAAEGGIVAYKGSGLKGYGNVVIIKHDNGLLSAYGFLSKTYVNERQRVKKRQKIGTVGYGANNKLMLHYEVRRRGKPVNPLNYIGSRYHF